MGAEEVLKSAARPLTTDEIVARVKDKNRNSVYCELKRLKKAKRIVRIEATITVTIGEADIRERTPIVFYKLIE